MKTHFKISIIIAITLLLTACAGSSDSYEQQIKLGYKFLSEVNYEEALVAFDAAIEIEAKRDKAYIGKADTYFAMGADDMIASINESLQIGYEMTQSKNIVNTYIRLADELMNVEKTDLALALLRLGYETTGDEKLKEHIDETIDKVSSEFLKNLYGLFEAGNIDEVKNIMRTDQFKEIAALTDFDNPACYTPTGTVDTKSGKGIGIYESSDRAYAENRYVYFGDYICDNKLQGYGGLRLGSALPCVLPGKRHHDR